LRKAVLGGVRADELLARPFLVVIDLLVDLRLEAHGGEREIGEVAAARLGRGFVGRSVFRRLLGNFCLRLAGKRQELLLPCLQLTYPTLRVGKVAPRILRLGYRQRRARPAPFVDVAPAIKVGLREHVRLGRTLAGLRVDEHDVHALLGVLQA
jgi:hypothetical protein